MKVTNELKPCPFCGGEAEFVLEGFVVGRVRCIFCRISQVILQPKNEAIKSWNKRNESKENV